MQNLQKKVVKNAMNMCKAGGFHLTKFLNSQKLLLSIPVSQRRIGVKDQDQMNFQTRKLWEFAGKLGRMHSPPK